MYQYGRDEVDPDNYKRLLSSEPEKYIFIRHTATSYLPLRFPKDSIVLIDSFHHIITTGALTGREARFSCFDDLGNRVWTAISSYNLGPNGGWYLFFCRGFQQAYTPRIFINIPLPSVIIKGGWSVVPDPTLQAGDTVSADNTMWYHILRLNNN